MTTKPSVLYREFSTGCSVQGTQTYPPTPQSFLQSQHNPKQCNCRTEKTTKETLSLIRGCQWRLASLAIGQSLTPAWHVNTGLICSYYMATEWTPLLVFVAAPNVPQQMLFSVALFNVAAELMKDKF